MSTFSTPVLEDHCASLFQDKTNHKKIISCPNIDPAYARCLRHRYRHTYSHHNRNTLLCSTIQKLVVSTIVQF